MGSFRDAEVPNDGIKLLFSGLFTSFELVLLFFDPNPLGMLETLGRFSCCQSKSCSEQSLVAASSSSESSVATSNRILCPS